MIRERLGDWRLAVDFMLAGLLGGLLIVELGIVGVMNRPFAAAQDQLFPAPAPDASITFVALDSRSVKNTGGYPPSNLYSAQVITYLAGLHPKVILFDLPLDRLTGIDPESDPKHPVNTDVELATAIQKAGNVVLVCTADQSPRQEFSTVAAAVGDRGLGIPDAVDAVRGVVLRPQTCPETEGDLPAFLLALTISEGLTTSSLFSEAAAIASLPLVAR